MIKKIILLSLMFFCFIVPVMAIPDYNYWDNHYISLVGPTVIAGESPTGVIHIYTDSDVVKIPAPDIYAIEELGLLQAQEAKAVSYLSGGSSLINYNLWGSYSAIRYTQEGGLTITFISGPSNYYTITGARDGAAIQAGIRTGISSSSWVPSAPLYVIHYYDSEPVIAGFDYTPSNPTIDDTIQFISLSTPKNKIDSYFWTIEDSEGELRASALNMDSFTYKGLSAGNYNVTLTVGNTTNSLYDTVSKNIEVISGVEVINRVNIKDASTQSLISGAELQIFNYNNDAWINSSYLYTGSTIFPANQSDVVDIYAQAENFFPAEKLGYIIPKTGGTISLLLSPDSPASNESLNRIQIIVKDDDSSGAIANVKLTVNQGGNSIVKYTNNDGYAVFELDPELIANILAEKSGYYELSKRLDISSPSSVDELRLTKITVAPTPTYTLPTPTLPPGQTGGGYNPVTGEYEPYYDPDTGVYVTPTFVGGWGETEFEENICIKAPYPNNWGYMDILQNGIACNGVKGAVNQKLILSLIIITVIALVLSRYAKGTGALAGGIVGSLVCMGMGLLPIWIAILMVVICGIVIAKMIIGGAK